MKKFFLTLCSIFLFVSVNDAQNWEKVFEEHRSNSVTPTQDGGYVAIGGVYINNAWRVDVLKTDAFGEKLWSKQLSIDGDGGIGYDVIETSNGNLLITGHKEGGGGITGPPTPPGPFLLLLDTDGNEIWSETYTDLIFSPGPGEHTGFSVIETADGRFVMAGSDDPEYSNFSFALIADVDGNWLDQKYLFDTTGTVVRDVIACEDGGFLFVGRTYGLSQTFRGLKTNASLETEWIWEGGDFSEFDRVFAATELNGHFYIVSSDNKITKLNSDGDEVASFQYLDWSLRNIIRSSDNQLLFTGQRNNHLFLQKIDENGNTIWVRTFESYSSSGTHLRNALDDGVIIVGTAILSPTLLRTYLVKTNANGLLFDEQLQGFVALDENGNCSYEADELGFENWTVKAANDDGSFYGSTDIDGFYDINIAAGTYQISVFPPGHYWTACEENISVTVETQPGATSLDIPMEAVVECPELTVDVSSPFLRRCFDNYYTVSYCNHGTMAAAAASVVITLDPFLEMVTSSLPFVDLGNQQFEFTLGDLPIDECANFTFVAHLDCDNTTLGQIHCVTANIFPDTICIDPVWLGPIIKVEKECSEDGVTFTIKNIGGDMNNTLDYIVIEDNIILREEPYQLAAGQSEQVVIEMAEGSVYHLSAEQDPLMPPVFGDAFATSTLLNCNNEDPFYSYYLWFADDDELLHTAEDCQENIGSFDPNDKAASPRGLGAANFLRSNVGLEYKIRFQNTGTDTAFTVVIEDEVSPLLDLSTIRPGTSSHDYEFNIVDRKIIFTFNNIMLPDSNVNEVASHGFVQFKIDQIADNPIGTVLRNSAAIFFDFNDPIITNEVKHIIDNGSFTTSTTLSLIDTSTPILVFPNPFENLVHFELNKTINGESFDFELFDVLGRSVFRDQFSGHQYRPSLGALSSGIYYYSVSQSGAKIDSGKLIKQ